VAFRNERERREIVSDALLGLRALGAISERAGAMITYPEVGVVRVQSEALMKKCASAAEPWWPATMCEDRWSAGLVDYLFLAFNTSTAFSPTDSPILSRCEADRVKPENCPAYVHERMDREKD
jgi:hypothetical protein